MITKIIKKFRVRFYRANLIFSFWLWVYIGISLLLVDRPIIKVAIAQEPEKVIADRLYKEAEETYKKQTRESQKEALEKFNEAKEIYHRLGEGKSEATITKNIGNIYSYLGEKQKALDYYNLSLSLARRIGDKSLESINLNNIGLVYKYWGERQKGLEYFHQSLVINQAIADRLGEAISFNNIGLIYSALGEKKKALEYYNLSLPLYRTVGDREGESNLFSDIGTVYADLGEQQKALDYYHQSLFLKQTIHDFRGEANTLNNIANTYYSLGNQKKALDYYQRSLTLKRTVGDLPGQTTTLNGIGLVYLDLGEQEKALDYFHQSLDISVQIGDRPRQSSALISIGSVYSNLGESQKALEYYNQALPIKRAVSDRSGEANTLIGIGNVYKDLGKNQEALLYYNQALVLKQAVSDPNGEANTLIGIGNVYNKLGEQKTALAYYNRALPLKRIVSDPQGEAKILNNLGFVYADLGEIQKALNYYNQSLVIARAGGDYFDEANTLLNLSILKEKEGNLQESLSDIESALKIIENLRTKIISQDLRISYFATVQDYYKFYINLLMKLHKQKPNQGFNIKALEVSDRSRARSLIELLAESKAKIHTGIDPKLLEEEQNIQAQIDNFEKNSQEILINHHTPEKEAELKQQEINLIQEYNRIRNKIRITSPRYADLKYHQPLMLSEIQQYLDDQTISLQYSLDTEVSYLWLVTKTEVNSYELPKQKDIEKLAENFRNVLTIASQRDLLKLVMNNSNALSNVILKPVAEKLGKKRLLIVPDGALQYIPFSALTVPGKPFLPLIAEHEIIMSPSVSTIGMIRKYSNKSIATQQLAIFADPVFSVDDERFGKAIVSKNYDSRDRSLSRETKGLEIASLLLGIKWGRLPFTRKEANGIITLTSREQSQEYLDFDVNRDAVNNPNLNQYQIIHFATHGFIDTEHPELSAIILSLVDQKKNYQNGYLRLNDIFNLNLNAKLIVLSACETGLGKEIKGEGIVGLTRGFIYAGAQQVLVSLWSINDKSTAEFMVNFYRKILKDKLTVSAALRAAQLEMWQEGKWKSPYYWATFTIQGDWN